MSDGTVPGPVHRGRVARACARQESGRDDAARQQCPGDGLLQGLGGLHVVFLRLAGPVGRSDRQHIRCRTPLVTWSRNSCEILAAGAGTEGFASAVNAFLPGEPAPAGEICPKLSPQSAVRLPLAGMGRGATRAMTTFAATIAAALVVAPVGAADPPVQPKDGAPCDAADPDSQTYANPQAGAAAPDVLLCVGFRPRHWQRVNGLQRPVNKFYTYGPTETLLPGDVNLGDWWDGVGSTTDAVCVEEQSFSDGRPPETRSNNAGQYFGFRLSPDMSRLSLKGNCRWLISPCNGKPGPCTAGYVPPGIGNREREI